MAKIIVIAEKPSLGRVIQEALGSKAQVCHCFGHMLESAPPEHYDPKWKRWDTRLLPITVSDWALIPIPDKKAQLDRICDAVRGADVVVHAGDPDREGQLLVDEVIAYCRWRGRTERMLIREVSVDAIRAEWEKRQDNAKFRSLSQAAECRQRADWLVGMNLTRAATRMLADEALVSVGRVQTPTLALVVNRDNAIKNFKTRIFYTIRGQFRSKAGARFTLNYRPKERITDSTVAFAIAKQCTKQQTQARCSRKRRERQSPFPYKLGDYQGDAERAFGWTLTAALKALQEAYEAGYVTYPRSDCKYLPEEMSPDASGLAAHVGRALGVDDTVMQTFEPKKRVYVSSKVGAHHAIIPTRRIPSKGSVSPQVWKAWKLVSVRFMLSLLPDEVYTEILTEATLRCRLPDGTDKNVTFKGKVEEPDGQVNWKSLPVNALLQTGKTDKGAGGTGETHPAVKDGEAVICAACKPVTGKTVPPKPYTPATLREDMENVAKFTEDEKIKAILKETEGIGRPSTQAAIVETLLRRGFIESGKGSTLTATKLGIAVIEGLPKAIADPVLTAMWEAALGKIAEGQYKPEDFMRRADRLVENQIERIRKARLQGVRVDKDLPKKSKGRANSKNSPRKSSSNRAVRRPA